MENRMVMALTARSPPYFNTSGLGNSLKPEFPLFFVPFFSLFLHIPEKKF